MRHNPISNVAAAAINKTIGVVGPFIIRTIIIYKLGSEYVGLNSLFTSLLLVLNMVEFGFGAALTYSMYKPVNDGDYTKLSELLNYYKNVYRIIGLLILTIGLLFCPFIKFFIKGDYPTTVNIVALFVIYLSNTVLSYLLFAYKSSVLIAYRKNDLVYLVQGTTQFLMYCSQAFILICLGDFYLYAIMMSLFTIANNIIINLVSNHLYPQIKPVGQLKKEEKVSIVEQVKALFIHRLAGVLIATLDNVFVSAILGLVELAIFTNYFYIVNALNGLIEMMSSSMASTIGNDLINLSTEKNYKKFCNYTYILTISIGLITVCLYNMLQPFIALWVGANGVLPKPTLVLFCLYFYSWKMRSVGQVYRDAAGIWRRDVIKSALGIVVDIVLNYVLIMTIGVNGALISTIVVMLFIFLPWETRIVIAELFHIKPYRYVRILFVNSFLTVAAMILSGIILDRISFSNRILDLIMRLGMSIMISSVVLVSPTIKSQEFKQLSLLYKKGSVIDE